MTKSTVVVTVDVENFFSRDHRWIPSSPSGGSWLWRAPDHGYPGGPWRQGDVFRGRL